MRQDPTTPDTRLSDDMNHINPAITETLTELMLGGLPTGRIGYPLHCRLRYFDPNCQRAGIPKDVAALVEEMTDDSVTVNLVNISPVHRCTVVVQGGGYAEHRIVSAELDGRTVDVDGSAFRVSLEPGCGGRIKIEMNRYANQPTFAFPWDRGC
jgi:hypothetical protein